MEITLSTLRKLTAKQISMTVRYSHLTPQHQLAAVERLAAASPVAQPDTASATRTATEQVEQSRKEVPFVH